LRCVICMFHLLIVLVSSDGVSRHVSRLETHIYTSLSWLSLDTFMSCLGSSLLAPCLVLALSHDCFGVSQLKTYFAPEAHGLSTTVL